MKYSDERRIELEIIKRFEREKKKLDEPNIGFPQDMNFKQDLKESIIKGVFYEIIESLEEQLEFQERKIKELENENQKYEYDQQALDMDLYHTKQENEFERKKLNKCYESICEIQHAIEIIINDLNKQQGE